MSIDNKIGLFIAGYKGYLSFKSLLENNIHEKISFVCSYPVNGMLDNSYQDIKDLCERNSIEFQNKKDYEKIKISNVDHVFVIGWQYLIKKEIHKLIILHDSLLPKYRGFSPLVTSLINGEREIGATAFFPVDEVDAGKIILQQSYKVNYPIKIKEALEVISSLNGQIILNIMEQPELLKEAKEQSHSEASFSIWLDKDDYYIDWNWSAERIQRKINANGWPFEGSKTKLDGEEIIIELAEVQQDLMFENRCCGKVWKIEDNCPHIICGQGILKIISAKHSNNNKVNFSKIRSRLR